jgi:hypothetical protein
MGASVTMEITEYNKLISERQDAWNEIGKLNAKLEEMQRGDPATALGQLQAAWLSAMTIVRFAVAHLSPEWVSTWPVDALRHIVAHLKTSVVLDDQEFAITLDEFVNEIVSERRIAARDVGLPR